MFNYGIIKKEKNMSDKLLTDKIKEVERREGVDNIGAFKKELERLLNTYSIENECNMPDFLLAEMIVSFIKAVGPPIKKTLDWHGRDSYYSHKNDRSQNPDGRFE